MRAVLDLMGIYNYDNTVLDNLKIPAALDRQTLIDNLLMESAELEILYSDSEILKYAIGAWSSKQLPIWDELYDTTQYEYNPIWNKDGTITELETRNLAGSDHTTDNTDRVDNLSDTETRDLNDLETRNLNDSNTHSVYGFNSSTAAPESADEGTQGGTDNIAHTGTDTFNHTGRQDIDRTFDKATTDTGTIKHERTEQGNIGLTSTQELIEKQRAVVEFNIMDVIIKDFIRRFCLGVY